MLDVTVKINDIDCMHIRDAAALWHRSIPSIRYLIENGNSIRPLAHIRVGSRLYIPKFEITGYPFCLSGPGAVKDVYHYVLNEEGEYVKKLCPECTFGQGCSAANEAATKAKELPTGDA